MLHAGSGVALTRRRGPRSTACNALLIAAALLSACAEVGPSRPEVAETAGGAPAESASRPVAPAPPPRAVEVPAPPPVAAAPAPVPKSAAKPKTAKKAAAKPNGGAREAAAGGDRPPAPAPAAGGAGLGSVTGGLLGSLDSRGARLAARPAAKAAPRPAETAAAAPAETPVTAAPAPAQPVTAAPSPAQPVSAPTFAAAAAYHVPTPMTVGQADTVRLWLDKRATAEALLARLGERVGGEAGVMRAEEVPATPRMRATLSGAAFDIKPLFDEVQTVYENKDTRWEWEVVPKEEGTHELRVHLRMVLPGTEDSLDSRVWPVQVVAKPLTPWQQFKAWLKEAQEVDAMIKGIFGIGIAGVMAWLWARFRRRSGPAADGPAAP
jgi:hypothetical protein